MDLENEYSFLKKRLETNLEELELSEKIRIMYFLIGIEEYYRRFSGTGTPAIPPTPVKVKCPHCGQEF
jgi:hypothetical protein